MENYEIWGKVLTKYGYLAKDTSTAIRWCHPETLKIIVCPKNYEKPYIFHAALDPFLDCFESTDDLDCHLKNELVRSVMLK